MNIYLNKLAEYSPTTIKERFRIIKRAFDYAYSQNMIKDNFMSGYNAIEKPKTKVTKIVQNVIALTLDKEKQLIDYLETTPIYNCKHKYYFYYYLQLV